MKEQFERETGKPAYIETTDGVHVVLIKQINPEYVEWLENDKKKLQKLYDELMLAVGNKYENESRHATALRYIKQAETLSSEGRVI